ncbi:MAG: T9SS type A sorting domain-containing protein [bacterium]
MIIGFLLSPLTLMSQEVLLPLQHVPLQRCPVSKSDDSAVGLPFFDDFAGWQGTPDGRLWQRGGVLATDGAGLLPPTVGVVTLDALDASGNLYPTATTSLFPADTLLSRPVKLDNLVPGDSVVLSFYYLPGGGQGNLWERIGDAPDDIDSLFLDFYRPADSMWVTVWSRGGTTVDSLVAATGRDWQYVTVGITDNAFFDSAFCFRFRNYCSLPTTSKTGMVGNSDYWHLDYVVIDRNRTTSATPVFHDVAFVNSAPSMLRSLRAMPARQYRVSDMADALQMTITNLYSSTLATQYDYAVLNAVGDTVYYYDGGYENAPPFLPDGSYQTAATHARPTVGYAFPESMQEAVYTVVHIVSEGVGGDEHGANDTVRYSQVFGNYYAYDDGTAENGYGLTSTASRVYLAYRIDLHTVDTLTAVDIFFNRTLDGENELIPFKLSVWQMSEDGRPGRVLYRDQESRLAEFDGRDGFHRYVLEAPLTVEGSIFVGFEQENNDYINIGFDRSHNTSDRIYYLTGTEWQQSILSGSLMLRPCFGTSATVGVVEVEQEHRQVKVYPNPANNEVVVDGLSEDATLQVFDMTGRLQMTGVCGRPLDISGLAAGVYLLRCVTSGKDCITVKLVVNK